jgi:hypothetical protein
MQDSIMQCCKTAPMLMLSVGSKFWRHSQFFQPLGESGQQGHSLRYCRVWLIEIEQPYCTLPHYIHYNRRFPTLPYITSNPSLPQKSEVSTFISYRAEETYLKSSNFRVLVRRVEFTSYIHFIGKQTLNHVGCR